MDYKLQLKTEKWKLKRKFILKRDKFKCKKCGSKDSLHVHHKIYEKGLMAWESKNENLITLCSECHAKEHNKKPISSFLKVKKVSQSKNAIKKREIKSQMNASRKEQERYNKFGY